MAEWNLEKEKIDYLIEEVRKVNGVFIRNGKEYPPKKAADHLKMKLDKAADSWFAPKKEKWTAVLFINKIATKSSLSGKPYEIRFSNGKKVYTGKWLLEKLKNYSKK